MICERMSDPEKSEPTPIFMVFSRHIACPYPVSAIEFHSEWIIAIDSFAKPDRWRRNDGAAP
jgi:hypothetical protein